MAHVMVIGLGGTGGKVLRRLHEHLSELPPDQRRRFRLLAIDTDRNALQSLPLPEDAKIHASVDVRNLRRNAARHPWLARFPLKQLPAVVLEYGAGQRRPLGALAFAWNFPTIRAKVHDVLWHLRRRDQGEGEATSRILIAVIASLAGGTGSGMFIDVGYLLRHELNGIGAAEEAEVLLFAVGPNAFHDVKGPFLLSNSAAALRELEYWMIRGNFRQEYRPDLAENEGGGRVEVDGPPFHWVFYLDAIDEGGWVWGGIEDLADMVANALLVLAADPVGGQGRGVLENLRESLGAPLAVQTSSGELLFLNSIGTASLRFPVSRIIEVLAARRGKALLESALRPAAEVGRAEAERWIGARPWAAQALAEAFRRRPDGSPLAVVLDPPEWLKEEDPEGMPHEALRLIDQIRQLLVDEEAARVIEEGSGAWLDRARSELEEGLARLVRDGIPAALAFVEEIRNQAAELRESLRAHRQEAEHREEGARARLTEPKLPWWWGLIGWIPGLGSWLRRRWAWKAVTRLFWVGEEFLKARVERMALEAAGQAVASLAGTIEERRQELEAIEARARDALGLLDREVEEALPKILGHKLPPALRVVDEAMLEVWEGRVPGAAPLELEEMRRCAAPEALAEQAKARFRPGLEFLRGLSIEDLIVRPDGIPLEQRLRALRAQGRAAWRLDDTVMAWDPAKQELIGVPDGSRSVFQSLGLGNRLVSTGDPYRVILLRLVVGVSISALPWYRDLRREDRTADPLAHVFPECLGDGVQPSAA
jgi:multidrug efflux pump subunit AcrA (membrane-fusion protein)